MSRIDKIINGLNTEASQALERIASSSQTSKEKIVRHVLAISNGRMVRTHQRNHRSPGA